MTNLVIIGAGPAGITAALEAGRQGLDVSIISSEGIGGRAAWHSLLPSKIYLTLADYSAESQRYAAAGLIENVPILSLDQTKKSIKEKSIEWHQQLQAEIDALGIRTITGKATFQDPASLLVATQEGSVEIFRFDRAIIASGSIPVFFPRIKPDGIHILAPRFAGALKEWPKHVVVIGGGVTGGEFAYLFSQMGSEVTWVTDLDQFLPRVDTDISAILEDNFRQMGITMIKRATVTGVIRDMGGVVVTLAGGQALSASHAFIAIGRKPDIGELNLEKAGIKHGPEGILVDSLCRTNIPNIYAAGDTTGAPFTANRGMAQARIAALSAAGKDVRPYDPRTVVEAVYTEPQLAQVGLTEQQANTALISYTVQKGAYQSVLKNHLPGTQPGMIKLLSDPSSGRILGAAAIGQQAAEVMSMAALAILGGLTSETLAGLFPATPTYGEVLSAAVRGY